MSGGSHQLTYREEQRLGSVHAALVGGVAALSLVMVVVPLLSRTVHGGGHPLASSGPGTPLLIGLGGIIAGLLPWFLLTLRMIVEVTPEAVLLRLEVAGPLPLLRPRAVRFEEILDASLAREFSWGAGVRYGWKRVSYRLKGSEGVEIVLRSGSTVFIGSARPDELRNAIESGRASGSRAAMA